MTKVFMTQIPSEEAMKQSLQKLSSSMDPRTLLTYILLRKMSTDLEVALDAYFSRFQLSSGRYHILGLLNDDPLGLKPSVLAQRVGVSQATISGLINSLEKAGLVIRKSDPRDGRAFMITLTDLGTQTLEKIAPDYVRRVDEFLSNHTPEEKIMLSRLLEKTIGNVEKLTKNIVI